MGGWACCGGSGGDSGSSGGRAIALKMQVSAYAPFHSTRNEGAGVIY